MCPGNHCCCLDPQVDSAFLERFCCLYLQHSLSLLREGLELVGTEKNDHEVSGTRSIAHSSLFSHLDDVSDGCENDESCVGVEKDPFIGAPMTLSGWLISHNIPLWLSLISFLRMWKKCKWQLEEAGLFALVEAGPFHTEGLHS